MPMKETENNGEIHKGALKVAERSIEVAQILVSFIEFM